jgi:DNA-binding SARP family transcriptional activator
MPIKDSQWKSKRAKSFLKLLVAHDGQKLARERAMEILWPDRESADLRAMFNSMLHRVRKVLEPQPAPGKDIFCIHQEGDLIALNSDLVWTDVRQFLAHVDRAAQLKSGDEPAELMKEYERTVSLYQGDFLPEDLYSDWAAELRDRLRAQFLRVLEDAGELADSRGEKTKALQFYEKRFLADSCSEKACRWLMVRYLSAGQRSEAIRTYERCERALSRDMDLEPEEKTKKLYRSIIGG